MSPGEYKSEDVIREDSFHACLQLIQPWIRRIHEDLKIQDPKLSELQSFRETLDEHVKGSIKDESQLFSVEEVQELSEKIDAFATRLKEMEERNELTNNEVKNLRQILIDAKTDLPEMTKGIWYRTAGGRVWEAMKNVASTGEARSLLADSARKLIGL